jgi:hypothetical protein
METFSQTSCKPQTVSLRQSSQINQKFVLACTALFQIEIFALLRSFRSFVANQFPFTDLISHLALTTTRPLAATLMQTSKSLPVIPRRRSCVIDRHGLTGGRTLVLRPRHTLHATSTCSRFVRGRCGGWSLAEGRLWVVMLECVVLKRPIVILTDAVFRKRFERPISRLWLWTCPVQLYSRTSA